MTSNEIERMLRLAVDKTVYETLRLISGDQDPYIHRGPFQPAPMRYEIPSYAVEVDVEVRARA